MSKSVLILEPDIFPVRPSSSTTFQKSCSQPLRAHGPLREKMESFWITCNPSPPQIYNYVWLFMGECSARQLEVPAVAVGSLFSLSEKSVRECSLKCQLQVILSLPSPVFCKEMFAQKTRPKGPPETVENGLSTAAKDSSVIGGRGAFTWQESGSERRLSSLFLRSCGTLLRV